MKAVKYRRCDRCGRRLRNPGPDCRWNAVVKRGVITGLLCLDCQTPGGNAEAEINHALLDYVIIDGRLAGRPKGGGR